MIWPGSEQEFLDFMSDLNKKHRSIKFKFNKFLFVMFQTTKMFEASRCFTISFIILQDFTMFYQIFLSPQVKQWVIINYKHGIYKLPNKLPNDLRLRILGNQEILSQYQQKSPEKWQLNFSCGALFHTKTRVSLRYFVTDCLQKPFFNSNSSQTPSNLFSLTILVSLRLLTLF